MVNASVPSNEAPPPMLPGFGEMQPEAGGMFPGFLNKLLKENRREDEWKMVEVVDKNTGRVFQELMSGPIVDDLAAEGVVA